ncbi:hypothetical protein ACXITP_08550 [Actinotignum sanguinis]|uniref:ATP synthase protein I n=2 Tax=Actinomycetaceae TaxID=2049 RepID=A0ABZ0RED3_9ACTO|nr:MULTISPECIES: hypothetical protein [Actinotignum]WPJ89157.1 hypothetical protein R0V15_00755 [Schaalia turicensis]MDE1553556.1 hypothetical protein [Actinotignum sanguinis]MDE1564763.1 hypothetical protein [Actinotignum sanguinis]MDE1576798.1 hypothetical protein [Actinotignum sanguinis]MDE1642366.1 hypothetical protein [Actinotignum sanguinis]
MRAQSGWGAAPSGGAARVLRRAQLSATLGCVVVGIIGIAMCLLAGQGEHACAVGWATLIAFILQVVTWGSARYLPGGSGWALASYAVKLVVVLGGLGAVRALTAAPVGTAALALAGLIICALAVQSWVVVRADLRATAS